ncbi:MAG TPA: Clp protease N-terminal domain-containing protein [Ktedonobacterales bacterium]|nr:Clp protease N-terminal domain-containing protein [Ktedonobacterales bacterium]
MPRRFGGGHLVALSARLYRALLLAYPPRFRRAFGDEMARVFRDSCREAVTRRGPPALVPLWLGTLRDLAISAAGEWRGSPAISQRRAHAILRGRTRRRQMMRRRNFDPFDALRRFWRGVARSPRRRVAPSVALYGPGARLNERDRFTGFTERARLVLSLSQQEAQRLHHTHMGAEHLLLGLIREGDGVAAQALRALGVDLDAARTRVEFIIGRGDHEGTGDIGLTPRAKQVVELAASEAHRRGHHYVGTEHLLLGIADEGQSIGAGVLHEYGVGPDEAGAAVERVLRGRGGPDGAGT